MGYFLEPLLLLAPFGKKELQVTLTDGITSIPSSISASSEANPKTKQLQTGDIGVDLIRTGLFPILQKFGIEREELRVIKRGSAPLGGGQVQLYMPHRVLQPKTIHATHSPNIDKIQGLAYSTRVSPASVNRIVDAARDVLKPTGCQTYIHTLPARGDESGLSPGFGVTLTAETKEGWTYCAECVANPGDVPEDIGKIAAAKLLEELSIGGVVFRGAALQLTIVLMVLGKEDIGRIVLGKGVIDAKFVRLLRTIKKFFGVEVILKELEDSNFTEVMCLVKGIGFVNSNKKIA